MTIQEIRDQVNKVLGNSLKCLLPSYWFKRLFGITLDKVEEVDRTSMTALTSVNELSNVANIKEVYAGEELTEEQKAENIKVYRKAVAGISYGNTIPIVRIKGYPNIFIASSFIFETSNNVFTTIGIRFRAAQYWGDPELIEVSLYNDGTGIIVDQPLNDSELTSSSYMAPQTKAVKAYVDNAISNIKPPTITIDSAMSEFSTNPVQNKVVRSYVNNTIASAIANTETPVVSATSSYQTIEPNKYYKWTSEMYSLTITLATPANESILNNYMFEFTTSSSGCTLNVPSTVKWANGEIPNIEASKTYQVSIINNLAVISNFI